MRTMSIHLSGGKFTSAHSSAIDVAAKILRRVIHHEMVTKVALGIIERKRCEPRLKIDQIPAGLRVKFFAHNHFQEVIIYTSHQALVTKLLQQEWDR